MPLNHITRMSCTRSAKLRAGGARVAFAIGFGLLALGAKTLNKEHPVRTFVEGRLKTVREPILSALSGPKSLELAAGVTGSAMLLAGLFSAFL